MNKDKLIIEIKKLERRLQINKKWSLSYVVEYTHQEGWGYRYDITSICDLKLNNNYKEIRVRFFGQSFECYKNTKTMIKLIEIIKEYFSLLCENEGYKYDLEYPYDNDEFSYLFTKNSPSLIIINRLEVQNE